MTTTPTPPQTTVAFAKKLQTVEDRKYILKNLPAGTRRIQVTGPNGKQGYKRPDDVDLIHDEISVNVDGSPVIMRGSPGRPKGNPLRPLTPQLVEVAEAREGHVDGDLLIIETHKDSEGTQVLDQIMVGLAAEAASLEFDRNEAHRKGEDGSHISVKRARVLKTMADTLIMRKKASEGKLVDMESPQFSALFSYTLETFKGAMVSAGCRPELVETVFTRLGGILDDSWREEAKARMRGDNK